MAIVFLLASLLLVYGAWKAFPIFDDGWFDLMVREQGPEAVERGLADRPVYGWLLKWAARIPGPSSLIYSIINLLIWLLFAAEGAMLWRLLYPRWKQYSAAVALLIVTPVAVQTQLCTMSVNIPSTLSAVLGYGGLLALYRYAAPEVRQRTALLVAGAGLFFAGVMVSEYAIPVAIQTIVLLGSMVLLGTREDARRRALHAAAAAAVTTPLSYALYRATASLTARPDVAPGVYGTFPDVWFHLVTGTCKILAGAYGTAIAQLRVSWDSKSEMLGLAIGIVTAVLLLAVFRRGRGQSPGSFAGCPHPGLLAVAVMLGLTPVALMGRSLTLGDTGSRFLIGVLPVAVAFTVRMVLGLVRDRLQGPAVAFVCLTATYALTADVFQAIQFHNLMRAGGEQLKPLVAAQPGLTLAIVPAEVQPNTLIGKAAQGWDTGLTRRLWMTNAPGGAVILGPRDKCLANPAIEHRERGLLRIGPVRQALWIEVKGPRPRVEPYCLTLPPQPALAEGAR